MSDASDAPMISAICVSHSSRFGLLQRAVLNFLSQDYPNKELLIVVSEDGYLDRIRSFLTRPEFKALLSVNEAPIRLYQYKFRQPSEALSHALAWADGSWIVAWDDDNLSHPERLGWQLSQTDMNRPSFLAQSLYFFYDSDELFLTDYSQPAGQPWERCAVSSMMFHRHAYQPLENQSQSVWAIAALGRLLANRNYDLIAGDPTMYLVGANGDNARGVEYHRKAGSQLPNTTKREALIANQALLETRLKAYSWPKPEIEVQGKDAQAFKITDGVSVWPDWLASPLPPEDWHAGLPTRELTARIQQEQQANQPPTK